uniref:Uncharacterized protein n=1 Tax=Serratia phage Kevin TaxID=3161161 RepID=A0AAU8KWR1_9CAUD
MSVLEEVFNDIKLAASQAPACVQNPASKTVILGQISHAQAQMNNAFDQAKRKLQALPEDHPTFQSQDY